jgi:4-diphosphocytidyl-2-C-methyl-D-erythritol kinase
MTAVEVLAPAKINLTLHVTGQRADGYHLLDSLVAFAGMGDRLRVAPAASLSLRVTGPRGAGLPEGPENLVWRAAALAGGQAAITLEKHLPAASGIGGGSSDAAACLRALAALDGRALPADLRTLGADLPVCLLARAARMRGIGGGSSDAAACLRALAALDGRALPADLRTLGADLPVCLLARAARMRGIGEEVAPVEGLPALEAVLVNPGLPVATPAVFARLARRDNPAMPATLPRWRDAAECARWLTAQRNDLEPPAQALCPEIATALAALRESAGCALARMSGSGATCFGLYPSRAAAEAAAARIAAQHPGWWVAPTRLS